MELLYASDAFTQTIDVLAALLAILIAFYFIAAYKRYAAQLDRENMLDQFLKD